MYNQCMNLDEMWLDFSDVDLATLCYSYGIQDECIWRIPLKLANRDHVQRVLTNFEMNIVEKNNATVSV